MCEPISIIAAASTAMNVAGQVGNHMAADAQSSANARYAVQNQIRQMQDRRDIIAYQNQVYQQDIEYARDMLAWAEGEWGRQVEYDGRARAAVEKNTLAAVGQILLRQVEEDMSTILAGTETRRQGTMARAQVAARDRGVEGNSVDAILQDVARQEGEVLNVMAMNRQASLRQLNREAIAADAQGDQALASIQLKTYAPSTQIRAPGPVASVQQAQTFTGPSTLGLVTGIAGAVGQGVSAYSSLSGQKVSDTVSDLGKWFGRQFSITPTPAG